MRKIARDLELGSEYDHARPAHAGSRPQRQPQRNGRQNGGRPQGQRNSGNGNGAHRNGRSGGNGRRRASRSR